MPRASRSSSAVPSLGLDIVEVSRVARLARDKRFLARVFTPEEVRYCEARARKWQHYAVRFAAKEAVWKALGRPGVSLRSISVRNSRDGRPAVLLSGRPEPALELSLSHCDRYAAAVALHWRARR